MSENKNEHPYFGDVLVDNGNGCQMDLRLKLAIEFLKAGVKPSHPPLLHWVPGEPPTKGEYDDTVDGVACHALDLASHLLAQARVRGLLKDLPDHGELTSRQRHHIERVAATNVHQNEAQNRIMAEGAPRIAPGGLRRS